MMVRVYFSEADHEMKSLLKCLHDELKVRGVTVIRGIAGYGSSGVVHKSSFADFSLDVPLVRQAKLGASCRVKVPVGEG
jgi:PII-like signaling protein